MIGRTWRVSPWERRRPQRSASSAAPTGVSTSRVEVQKLVSTVSRRGSWVTRRRRTRRTWCNSPPPRPPPQCLQRSPMATQGLHPHSTAHPLESNCAPASTPPRYIPAGQPRMRYLVMAPLSSHSVAGKEERTILYPLRQDIKTMAWAPDRSSL